MVYVCNREAHARAATRGAGMGWESRQGGKLRVPAPCVPSSSLARRSTAREACVSHSTSLVRLVPLSGRADSQAAAKGAAGWELVSERKTRPRTAASTRLAPRRPPPRREASMPRTAVAAGRGAATRSARLPRQLTLSERFSTPL